MVLLSDSILYLELGNEISTVVHGDSRLQRRIMLFLDLMKTFVLQLNLEE